MAYKQPYYICKFLPIRFFVPYDTFVDNAKRLKKAGRLNYGRLEILDPHRDSWFTYPFNSLNIWITMSRVIPGNGMIVYPEMWDQSTAHTGSTISREQTFVGQPIDLMMNPGDLLLFRGEHLHASELNFTQETRYATTARFTLKAPIYGEGNLWKPHVYTPFLNTPWERFAEWRSYCSLAFLRMKGLQLKKKLIKQPKKHVTNHEQNRSNHY
jgi:ectoine hydroxylase-related dioxygenase (phytanoyl-CoA dioxygenase family)